MPHIEVPGTPIAPKFGISKTGVLLNVPSVQRHYFMDSRLGMRQTKLNGQTEATEVICVNRVMPIVLLNLNSEQGVKSENKQNVCLVIDE